MREETPSGETVIPLAGETATVSKREVETGRVRVALGNDTKTAIARETLRGRRVEVERVTVERDTPAALEQAPPTVPTTNTTAGGTRP
jgi:Domain of unknown function (DUF2382)